MYTQCPECLSVFSVDASAVAQAHGHVQCGHCHTSFDSLATLADQLPPEPFEHLPINEPSLQPPALDLVIYRPQSEPPVIAGDDAGRDAANEDFSKLVFAPRFARDQARKSNKPRHEAGRPPDHPRRWPWLLACGLLTVLLAAQLGWAKRDVLIRDPLVGGWLQDICHGLGCHLPLVAAPDQLRLLASNVQAHPGVDNALMISARVRNQARFAQPWPVLVVSLADAHGKRLAMRRLRPAQYLEDPATIAHGLAPGATAVLLLEVEDPGSEAVAFELGFR